MDDGWAILSELILGDDGSSERGERGESRGTLPDGILAIGLGNDSNLGGRLSSQLLVKSVWETLVHGGTTGEDDVLAELLPDVQVSLLDGRPGEVLDRLAVLTVERGLKEKLSSLDLDKTWDGDLGLVWQSVEGVLAGTGLDLGKLLVEALGNVALSLLDGLDDFLLSRRDEVVAGFHEESLAVVVELASSDVHLLDGVRHGESFEDGHGMSDTIARVDNNTSGSSDGVERHDGLEGDVRRLNLELLEQHFDHLLSVLLGVPRSLSHEDTCELGGVHSEFVVESVMPHRLHVGPVLDDTGGDGVLQVEDTSLGHSVVSDVDVLLSDTLHSGLGLGLTDDRAEDAAWGLISRHTGLHHTGSVIDDSVLGSIVFFNHCVCVSFFFDYFCRCRCGSPIYTV